MFPDLQTHFESIPPAQNNAASALANTIAEQMIERLSWVKLEPSDILEVGCGGGQEGKLLRAQYPKANVYAIDFAYPFLAYAKHENSDAHFICADTYSLPFQNASFDLIYANLVLPWCHSIETVLAEWRRVLRPSGVLVFSSLGPDSLQPYRDDLSSQLLPNLIDMHHLGDNLLQAKFIDPVLDVDHLTLRYRDKNKLLQELLLTGFLREAVPLVSQDIYDLSFEVVYATAFSPSHAQAYDADEEGVVKIPLAHLRGRAVKKF